MKIFGFKLPSFHNPFASKALKAPAPQNAHAFNEFVRRITPDEKKKLDEKLAKIIDSSSFRNDVNALKVALQTQNWDAPVFHNKDYPYLALAALHEGAITPETMATILIFYSAQTETDNIKTVPLFILGKINEEAKKLIIETWPEDNKTEEHILPFFEKMRQADPTQQQFFLIPYDQDKEFADKNENQTTITGLLHGDLDFNVFGLCSNNRHMQASPGMMQAFLDVCYGDRAVKINPVIGLSSENDIHDNGLFDKRDMGLLFPGTLFPLVADNRLAQGFRFWYHDFYHACAASLIPAPFRHLYIQFADLLLTHQGDPKVSMNEDFRPFWNGFVDMEMTKFQPDDSSTLIYTDPQELASAFWNDAADRLACTETSRKVIFPKIYQLVEYEQLKSPELVTDAFIQKGKDILTHMQFFE